MARGEKRRKRASVRVRIEVEEIDSYVRHDLIDVDLAETCDGWADDVHAMVHQLVTDALERSSNQALAVFPSPTLADDEIEEVGSE